MTRDSKMLALAALIAAGGYMANLPNPLTWTYHQWLGALLAGALWLSGKLASSPLPHSEDK